MRARAQDEWKIARARRRNVALRARVRRGARERGRNARGIPRARAASKRASPRERTVSAAAAASKRSHRLALMRGEVADGLCGALIICILLIVIPSVVCTAVLIYCRFILIVVVARCPTGRTVCPRAR